MDNLNLAYSKFLIDNDNRFAEIKDDTIMFKFSCEDFIKFQVNIKKLSTVILKHKSKGGLFLTALNDNNFIKLLDRLKFISGNLFKSFFNDISNGRKASYKILYDIRQDKNNGNLFGICSTCISGEYSFNTVPLINILLYYNTLKYWDIIDIK